jgi:hypothetical protein
MYRLDRRILFCLSLVAAPMLLRAIPHAAQVPDTAPPTITATATPAPNANGWNRTNVTVRFTCADSLSRIVACPKAIVVSADGAAQLVSGTARDAAGNTATTSVVVNLDKTAPLVTASRSPEGAAGAWSTTPITVSFDATDALSGVAPGSLSAPVVVTDRRSGYARGTATDLAGNVGAFVLTDLNSDTRRPTIAVTLSPEAVAGYRTGPVTAHFTCFDSMSGVATCPPDQVFSSEGRDQIATGTVTDVAGNTATASRPFNIDTTPPVLTITSPAPGTTPGSTITITGTATDGISGVVSLVAGSTNVRIGRDGSFRTAALATAGLESIVLVATDRAGLSTQRIVALTEPDPTPDPDPPAPVNLVQDPQFDLGVSGFFGQDESSTVVRTADSPLEGAHSLRVSINGYGNNVWWPFLFAGGRASALSVSAHLRSDVSSSSDLRFCAMAYYADDTSVVNCTTVDGSAGDKGTVSAALALDSAQPLHKVHIRLVQEGGEPVSFTLDAAAAFLDVVAMPPDGGGDGGGGGGGGGSDGGGPVCTPLPPGSTVYPGFVYDLPTVRPFISLSDFTQGGPNSTAALRLRGAADRSVAGSPDSSYSPSLTILAYQLTGQASYLADAIARVDQFVAQFEAAIAVGQRPAIAHNSYLEIGWYLDALSLTYDRGYHQLTPDQRQRWAALAEQALFNLWHPNEASWGGISHTWNGWSTCDPGNNYHFSFLRATMLWALASQNPVWFDFLQTQKFGPLLDYYAALPGGGTREGTGYGTALNNLFGNYIYWKASTGEDLANITSHPRETIDYWVHATVPTRDRFAPIADLSRSSIPELYDYQENLVHQAVVLSAGTPQARRGTWWLLNNSVNGVASTFNIAGDLLPYPDQPLVPTELMYHSPGAGALFARTGWDTGAAWMAVNAGKFDQSHAQQDQGSFTFFKNDWLAVTSNIWSKSGIHEETAVHNTLRFERSNGSIVAQNRSNTVQSSMTSSTSGGAATVNADLSNAFSANRDLVQSWTRTLDLSGDRLRVVDACTVAAGVKPVFQLQVPAPPAVQPDGSIVAGNLRVVMLQPATVTLVEMPRSEFGKGPFNGNGERTIPVYRIELTSDAGCSFSVELQAMSNP